MSGEGAGSGPAGTKLRVCSLESRRQAEMQSLIERGGGEALVVASMREIPLEENPAAFQFAVDLFADKFSAVVFMTGVGARGLLEVLEKKCQREEVLDGLRKTVVAVRGPKPLAVMREWKVPVAYLAPEPNTWRELLATLDQGGVLNPQAYLAVQEYGVPNKEFYAELDRRGIRYQQVPVYRWALPEDVKPLEGAIRNIVAGEIDVLLFTSAQQVLNLLQVADSLNLKSSLLEGAKNCLIGSIGPTTTETLNEQGLRADFEPEHPKMGHLVKSTFEVARERGFPRSSPAAG
ncbi:MAG: uroporphyrinogen-III synthase [Planctomycetales bacterium]